MARRHAREQNRWRGDLGCCTNRDQRRVALGTEYRNDSLLIGAIQKLFDLTEQSPILHLFTPLFLQPFKCPDGLCWTILAG
jgi:hypothetical protein